MEINCNNSLVVQNKNNLFSRFFNWVRRAIFKPTVEVEIKEFEKNGISLEELYKFSEEEILELKCSYKNRIEECTNKILDLNYLVRQYKEDIKE